jgi:transcriptional regulator with XRE-family HTH domain
MQTKEQFLKQLGEKLASIRKSKNISQEKLAEAIEVHRTYIGFIEQGKRNPSIWNIQKIAQALKIDIKELL